jgi:uncharacterized membrane protein YfcA
MNLMYSASGFFVGLLVGITGVGGGSLMTPLLVFMFGFKASVAVGTDLLYAAITKTGGVLVHHGKHKSVDWRVVGLLASGSIPMSILTLFAIKHYMDIGKETTGIITYSLGIALILTASALLIRAFLLRYGNSIIDDEEVTFQKMARFSPKWEVMATILTGIILGILVTLSSVGAGALGTVALLFLYPGMSTLKIVGTDLAHAIPLTAIGGFGHWMLGNVDFLLLGSLLIGSLPGIWIGSHLSAKVPEYYLRPVLASVLLLIGLKFVTQ